MKKAIWILLVGVAFNLIGVFLSIQELETISLVTIVLGIALELSGVALAAIQFLRRLNEA